MTMNVPKPDRKVTFMVNAMVIYAINCIIFYQQNTSLPNSKIEVQIRKARLPVFATLKSKRAIYLVCEHVFILPYNHRHIESNIVLY